jgi:Ca2+-binding EF-hand superfamily protein
MSEVVSRHDYNVNELFKLVDYTNKGFIDTLDLVRLLNRNRVHLPESEVEGIV